MRTINQSISAPDSRRMVVKLAASMLVFLSARRHSSELLANANIASNVSVTRRAEDISDLQKMREAVRPGGRLSNKVQAEFNREAIHLAWSQHGSRKSAHLH
jgi:hypothetical protein